ncbi:MAG TPA: hypothetical protein V6D07_11770, partial [Trichocoleus sp.]
MKVWVENATIMATPQPQKMSTKSLSNLRTGSRNPDTNTFVATLRQRVEVYSRDKGQMWLYLYKRKEG